VRSYGLPSEPGHRGVYASHRCRTAQTPSGCCGSSTAGPSGRNEHQAANSRGAGSSMARIRGWQRWLIVGVIVVAVLAVAGPYVYIHFIEVKAPKRLSLS